MPIVHWRAESGDKGLLRVVVEAQMVDGRVTGGAPIGEAVFEGTCIEEVRERLARHDVWRYFGPDEAFKLGVVLMGLTLTSEVARLIKVRGPS